MNGCYVTFNGNDLVLGNQLIERTYRWNNGNLISLKISDKESSTCFIQNGEIPDFYLPNEPLESTSGELRIEKNEASSKWNSHLSVEVYFQLGDLQVRRLFRIFPNTPALQCNFFFKGLASASWVNEIAAPGDLSNIEVYSEDGRNLAFAPVLENVDLPGRHWELTSVRFFDITDRYNNYCEESHELLYRRNIHKGNIVTLKNLENDQRFFMLKESPSYFSQLAYPGADFLSVTGNLKIVGIGVDSADILLDDWVRGYGFVSGFGGSSDLEVLSSLRTYQKNIFPGYARYEPIFITNTWGDRGKDTKIRESFIIDEIQAARKLGSNYLQIDDGWQTGLSQNTAFKGGSSENIWEREDYWNVNRDKFPKGFEPVLREAKKSNVRLSVWYSPSIGNSYADWEQDAKMLTQIYSEYGIRKIKVDLLKLNDKVSETRIRNMLDYAYVHTNQELSFDLDITANMRFGYHYFNEYGIYWVANRYTDWTNYYPYTVLRNLWLLSRYVPPEKLQMSFCNIWRNTEKYVDAFAPNTVSFDYAMATTMASQPMGFFETSGLPEPAFKCSSIIENYLAVQKDFHKGIILPIGELPDGRSWTGFQSISTAISGFILVFRELNDRPEALIETWLPADSEIILEHIAGHGKGQRLKSNPNGEIQLKFENSNSWALYKYTIQ